MRHPTKYCDLVMKGGITSGLVYPQAVLELAKVYRFKNIGGTSAGAIAAAMSAAAALGERRLSQQTESPCPPGTGMEGLDQVAAALTSKGFIYALFQPTAAARPAYRLLVQLAAKPPLLSVLGEIALALVRMAAVSMALLLLVLLGIGHIAAGWNGVLAALLPALACAVAWGVVRSVLATARAAGDGFLGLCPGLTQPGYRDPALTDWMHRTIRTLSGQTDAEERPVTFGDLWNAPAYADEPAGAKRLNLEIITTDVSHSEPRTLPFAGGGLYFREDQFRRLFPKPVVDWMVTHSLGFRQDPDGTYHHLPDGEHLPIVVAARMSLSFPLLISAVPLHELDFGRAVPPTGAEGAGTARKGERPRLAESADALASGATTDAAGSGVPFRPCWFTDGGVSSNFPIHLFDAPLPRWPTFAIDLVYDGTGALAEPIFLPPHNNAAVRPRYQAITGQGPLRDLMAFFFGIIGTMQNWRDLLQGRAPGHRDRIVRIALDADEGGMNLDMPETTLRAVAAKGAAAGRKLVDDFSFDNHFWVRYRNAASAIERFTISFGDGLQPPLTPDNAQAHDRMWSKERGAAGSYRFSKAQAEEAVGRLERIRAEASLWKDAPVDLTEGAPRPLPQLRVVPIF